MLDLLMGKLIPPRLALDAITANAMDTFKHPIKCYKADLLFLTEKVDILVTHPGPDYPERYQNETHQHKYWITEGPELIKMIKFKANEMADAKEGVRTVHQLSIEYNGKDQPYILTFYVEENGNKLKIVKTIN